METKRAEPKVLREQSRVPASATGLHKRDRVTVAATGEALRSKLRDLRPSNSTRALPGHSRRKPDQQRHLWRLFPSPIRSTLRKLGSSGRQARDLWKDDTGAPALCTR